MNHTSLFDPSTVDTDWCDPPTHSSTATSVVSENDADPLDQLNLPDLRGWWTGLRDTAGGVVRFVQRSAQTLAQEMAALELTPSQEDDEVSLSLPWEVLIEGRYRADPILKEKILQLSHEERTFTEPHSCNSIHASLEYEDYDEEDDDDVDEPFVLNDARVDLIHRLLELDPQLSQMHAQYSGRSSWRESDFWNHYFQACRVTRAAHVRSQGPLTTESNERQDDTPAVIRSSLSQLPSSSSFLSNNSFVPCSDDENRSVEGGDIEDSFVCVSGALPSAPNSCMSTGMKSVDSLVLVDVVPRDGDIGC